MRPSLLVAPLFLASATFARSPVKRGETTDTCANLDAELVFSDVEVDGKPYDAGRIDISLCISQVKSFVDHYNITEAAVKVVGRDRVESAVVAMIKKTGVQCAYPPHSKPAITSSDECDFVCMDGYLAMPPHKSTSCICPSHLKECNGQCGHFETDCSATPPPSRRQNEPKCAQGLTMCGVPNATSREAYKCTSIMSDSSTCGGCVKASTFGSPSTNGVNCHLIPNVDDVSCKDGKCFVRTCKIGYTVSSSNDACEATSGNKTAPDVDHIVRATGPAHVAYSETEDVVEPAAVVGNKVPHTHSTSGLAHRALANKLSGVPLKAAQDIPLGTSSS